MPTPLPGERPCFPDPKPPFDQLAPSHYRVLVRRCQHYTAKDSAQEFEISQRTVDQYLERAKRKLGYDSTQDLIQAFSQRHAPQLWPTHKADNHE